MKTERSGKIKNILSLIGIAIITVFAAYLLFYLVFDKVSPNQTVKKLGHKGYSILTDSMEPTIMVGDLVIIKKHDFDNLEEGDIIAFLVDSNKGPVVVVHRFLKYENALVPKEDGSFSVGEKTLVTTKEGSSQRDNWPNYITEDRFIGIYSFKIPKVGNVIMFSNHGLELQLLYFLLQLL